MKKLLNGVAYFLLNFVILIMLSVPVAVATPKYTAKVKLKLTPETLGPTAIVWRGQNYVGSNYFTIKSDSKSSGLLMGGFLGGLVGVGSGLVGGALGVGLREHFYSPPSKDTKSGAKDIEKEQVLASVLPDFNYQNLLKEQMMVHVFKGYQILQNIENNETVSPDTIYDYSSLQSQGVKTLIEIYPQAFFTPRTGLSGEATPCFAIRSSFKDLIKNKIIGSIMVSKIAPSTSTKEYDELLKNPEAIKADVLNLIPIIVEKYAKKINGTDDENE